MVFNRKDAVKRALDSHTNVPNTCQLWTRNIFGVPSVGDYDGDGAADAEDGWKSEPDAHKHPGDRHPPAGVPVSYGGGSHDNGHRAVSLGNGMIRSTDAPRVGFIGTVPLDWPEKNWGLRYLGWSNTCDGVLIPMPPPPKKPEPAPAPVPPKAMTRGKRIDAALQALNATTAKPGTARRALINQAKAVLLKIKPR